MTESNTPQIGIARIYTKDLSFESPRSPAIFGAEWRPEIKMDVAVRHRHLQETFYEVTLEITVEAREGQEVGFIVEVEQGGLFDIRGFDAPNLERALQIFCPTQIFPYARQVVDQALNHGGFAPLLLSPLNFEQLQRDSQARSAAARSSGPGDAAVRS